VSDGKVDSGSMRRSVPEGAGSVRVGGSNVYKLVALTRDEDGGFTLYGPRWTIAGNADEYAALRAALLERAQEVEVRTMPIGEKHEYHETVGRGLELVKPGRYLLLPLEGESEP
jgi:hypothetical protein